MNMNNLRIPRAIGNSVQRSLDPISDYIIQLKEELGSKYCSTLDEFEDFLEEDAWDDFETLKGDIADGKNSIILSDFFEKNGELDLFEKIKKNICGHEMRGNRKFLRAEHLRDLLSESIDDMDMHSSIYHSQLPSLSLLDQREHLSKLNSISYACKVALSEFVITKYHQQSMNLGWSLTKFIEKCGVLQELSHEKNKMSQKNKYSKLLRTWIEWYDKKVYKPLPQQSTQLTSSISDDISIVISYLTQINDAIYKYKYLKVSPVQLDVCFVPPNRDMSAFRLHEMQNMIMSDKNSEADGDLCYGALRLLRRAKQELSLKHGDRVILLIDRGNLDDCDNDRIYLIRADRNTNYNVALPFAVYSELPWIHNTKCDIIPGLNAENHGILTISHHIHSEECERVYASYERFGSRVFRDDLINRLPVLFKKHANKHGMSAKCVQSLKSSFECIGSDFRDSAYSKLGEYYFGPIRYDCFTPGWSGDNPRAMFNVFIDKESTHSLLNVISEKFENSRCLYYHLDYSFAMQNQDDGMTYFEFYKKGYQSLLIINTELHSADDPNKELYAICVENSHKSKQRWKMIGFCTADQIWRKYNGSINLCDLPKGSKARHNNFEDDISRIQISENLIRRTKWKNIRIIQSSSKHDFGARSHRNKGNGNSDGSHLKLSCADLKNVICDSFKSCDMNVIPIISFKFKRNKYYVEKLLPVRYSRNQWMAVTFRFKGGCGKTEVSAICLDLLDCRNKAALIGSQNGMQLNPIMSCNKNIKSLTILHRNHKNNNNNNNHSNHSNVRRSTANNNNNRRATVGRNNNNNHIRQNVNVNRNVNMNRNRAPLSPQTPHTPVVVPVMAQTPQTAQVYYNNYYQTHTPVYYQATPVYYYTSPAPVTVPVYYVTNAVGAVNGAF